LFAAIPERWFTPSFRAHEAAEVERILGLFDSTQAKGYIEACSALRDVDLHPRLVDVQAPTLVIGSAQDVSTPIERSEELALGISGADLLVLDAAHLSNVEQAAEFTTAVADFLRD
jgi:3-oxoadipate enol-lactonase